jgi:hypothetical protein
MAIMVPAYVENWIQQLSDNEATLRFDVSSDNLDGNWRDSSFCFTGVFVRNSISTRTPTRYVPGTRFSRTVVPNLWYAYLGGYAKIILVMAENIKKKKS